MSDQNKKVGIIPGLALLLSLLALFLIGLNAIVSSPAAKKEQKILQEQFEVYSAKLEQKLDDALQRLEKAQGGLRQQQVVQIRSLLDSLATDMRGDYVMEMQGLQQALKALEAKLDIKSPAPAAAPILEAPQAPALPKEPEDPDQPKQFDQELDL